MKENNTYGPEDIEALLSSKSFEELYPAEREYVLEHIEGEDEYERLRRLLVDVSSSIDDGPLAPSPATKEVLMRAYQMQHRKEKVLPWWRLNWASLVALPESRVAIPILAVVLIGLGFWWLLPTGPATELAVVEDREQVLDEAPSTSAREDFVAAPSEKEEVIASEEHIIREDEAIAPVIEYSAEPEVLEEDAQVFEPIEAEEEYSNRAEAELSPQADMDDSYGGDEQVLFTPDVSTEGALEGQVISSMSIASDSPAAAELDKYEDAAMDLEEVAVVQSSKRFSPNNRAKAEVKKMVIQPKIDDKLISLLHR